MLCSLEQTVAWARRYTPCMTFEQRKVLILSAWMATIAVAGFVLTIESPSMWIFVAALAMIPAAIANSVWNAPELTMAQLVSKYRQ